MYRTKISKLCIMHRLYVSSSKKEEQDFLVYDKNNMNLIFNKTLLRHVSEEKNQITLKASSKFKWKRLFEEGANYETLGGVTYSGICVCKNVVLNYFNDQFDYHCESKDFLGNLLNSEISDDQVSFSVLPSSVFFRKISSWDELVEAVVQLLRRSSFKFNINKNNFRFENFFKVVSNKSIISQKAGRLTSCFIGFKSQISEYVNVKNSILIENCKLMSNVSLNNCYLSSGTKIEENLNLSNVVILSQNLVISKEYIEKNQIKHEIDGNVIRIEDVLISENKEILCLNQQQEFEFKDNESYDLESESEEEEREDYFEREVRDIMSTLEEDFGNLEQIMTDIVTLRFSQDRSLQNCLSELLIFIFQYLFNVKDSREGIFNVDDAPREEMTKAAFMKAISKFQNFKPLLRKFTVGKDEKMFILSFLKRKAELNSDLLLTTLIQIVFKMELINSEVIIEWYEINKNNLFSSEFDKKMITDLNPFVDYLKSLDEDSDSDSEDDSEDNSEDDEDEDEESQSESDEA